MVVNYNVLSDGGAKKKSYKFIDKFTFLCHICHEYLDAEKLSLDDYEDAMIFLMTTSFYENICVSEDRFGHSVSQTYTHLLPVEKALAKIIWEYMRNNNIMSIE